LNNAPTNLEFFFKITSNKHELQKVMDELDECGHRDLTAAIRAALKARFQCAVCGQAIPGRLSEICYCEEAAKTTHHINSCCWRAAAKSDSIGWWATGSVKKEQIF
jgi:hypothetical protein